ncbi:MAG: acetyl-CoA decarbonylase/synthase complex subunit gamma, partial [bacterium]
MALSGIEIFKLLPKTNCKECGFPTCLAFAMQIASAKVEVEKCPHLSEETREFLASSQAPPIRKVIIGEDFAIGEETCFFRHEKTFVHPPAIALLIKDTEDLETWKKKLCAFNRLKFGRIGLTLKANLLFLENASHLEDKFLELVFHATRESDGLLCLSSQDMDVLKKAIEITKGRRPLLYSANQSDIDEIASIAKEYNLPLVAKEDGLDSLSSLSEKLISRGIKDIVLDANPKTIKEAFYYQIAIRRQALSLKFRPLGFPTITFPCRLTDDPMKEALYAATFIVKYGGIIVLSNLSGESLFPLLVLSLNIYTDPQRPMAIEEKIYEINSPDEKSPVCITTNFSLTYFIVNGEIEASKVPTYLMIMDTGGLSTLTSWSAGKFNGELISLFVKRSKIEERISHKRLIIPGYVASIKGEIEEELKGWEVIVGPREASDIPVFL